MNEHRGATPEEDFLRGYTTGATIAKVEPLGEGRWQVTTTERTGFVLRECWSTPKVGDKVVVFGLMDYPFYGQALNDTILWYLTPEQEAVQEAERIEQMNAEQEAQFEENREQLDADYATLPAVFKRRIDRFRAGSPDFRVKYEAYEMICCVDAVKLARHCKMSADKVRAWAEGPVENQRGVMSDGHSGNTWGMAIRLAFLYCGSQPELVEREHGAMAVLVGCEKYGCTHAPVAATT